MQSKSTHIYPHRPILTAGTQRRFYYSSTLRHIHYGQKVPTGNMVSTRDFDIFRGFRVIILEIRGEKSRREQDIVLGGRTRRNYARWSLKVLSACDLWPVAACD
jgi:hypothetical protein